MLQFCKLILFEVFGVEVQIGIVLVQDFVMGLIVIDEQEQVVVQWVVFYVVVYEGIQVVVFFVQIGWLWSGLDLQCMIWIQYGSVVSNVMVIFMFGVLICYFFGEIIVMYGCLF